MKQTVHGKKEMKKRKIEWSSSNAKVYRRLSSVVVSRHQVVEEAKQVPFHAKIYQLSSVVVSRHQVVQEAKQVHSTAAFRRRVIPRKDNGGKKQWLRAPKPERRIRHYSSYHKILLVGEGDFSFAACLAGAFGSADKMVATSLDSIEFLLSNYGSAMSNIHAVKIRGGIVLHGFDAIEMADNPLLKGFLFDRIVFNFPLAGFFRNESRESQLRRNQELVSLYFKNAMKMISEDGEIHVSHKSRGFFLQWNLPFLAQVNGLRLKEAVQFRLADYPGYNNKYGFGSDKNFDWNPSKTYKFELDSSITRSLCRACYARKSLTRVQKNGAHTS